MAKWICLNFCFILNPQLREEFTWRKITSNKSDEVFIFFQCINFLYQLNAKRKTLLEQDLEIFYKQKGIKFRWVHLHKQLHHFHSTLHSLSMKDKIRLFKLHSVQCTENFSLWQIKEMNFSKPLYLCCVA